MSVNSPNPSQNPMDDPEIVCLCGEEEEPPYEPPPPIPVCKCLTSEESSEKPKPNPRKVQIYSTVSRTEAYLRERRIPELMRFLMTKILTEHSNDPVAYLEDLLSNCMLFRSGLGLPPVLYERRHLEAVVKSFDPGNRGWLSPAQIRRAFTTLGFRPVEPLEENTPTEAVINELERVQEKELYHLLTDGTDLGGKESTTTASASLDSKPMSLVQLKPTMSSL